MADTAERIVGDPAGAGRSPRARLAPALGDWAREGDPAARVLVIGQGSVSANTLAPTSGGEVYWYSADAAGYVTSSYFSDTLPEWVARFNAEEMPSLVAQALPWTLGVPESARALALPDDTPWEGEAAARVFPHATGVDDPAEAFTSVPGLDGATLRLAEEGVRALELGRRGSTDVLMINLSSLDEAGHSFGPWSLEQLDALWRVDGDLGHFLDFLDTEVGGGRWALALTADHGAPPPPEQAGPPATRIDTEAMARVWSDLVRLAGSSDEGQRTGRAVAYLEALPWVADVYTIDELRAEAAGDDAWMELYRGSFREDRILDFPLYDTSGGTSPAALGIGAIRLTEGSIPDYAVSVHGSPYAYDRRVPLLVLGAGAAPGRAAAVAARITDVAPTLAALGGIPAPAGLDGQALLPALLSRSARPTCRGAGGSAP